MRTDLRDGAWLHGIVSPDTDRAVYAFIQLTTGAAARPGLVRLPGLSRNRRYRVQAVDPMGAEAPVLSGSPVRQPPWIADGVTLSGQGLTQYGLSMPVLNPAAGMLIEVRAVDGD